MRGHGEGTYYQMPSGKWRVQISINGKRIGHVGKTKKECRDWANDILGQVDRGLTSDGINTLTNDFFNDWIKSKKSIIKLKNWEYYNYIVDHFIIPYLGEIKLKDLTPVHIQKLYIKLQELNTGNATINKVHTILRGGLNYALEIGLIIRNPTDPVMVPRENSEEMKILDENQVSKLLLATKKNRWEALYYLAVTTGMREMELLGLMWADIDWNNNTILVQRQLLRKEENGSIFSYPKTKHSRRIVAIGTDTMKLINTHYQNQLFDKKIADKRWKDYGLVFTTKKGTPIHYSNLVRDFKMMLQKAGLPDMRFHDLRHTAISLMLNHGVPLIVVSRRVGHSNPTVTLNRYGHLIPHIQKEAAELIDTLVIPIELDLG